MSTAFIRAEKEFRKIRAIKKKAIGENENVIRNILLILVKGSLKSPAIREKRSYTNMPSIINVSASIHFITVSFFP
jgi:hypothetical protein